MQVHTYEVLCVYVGPHMVMRISGSLNLVRWRGQRRGQWTFTLYETYGRDLALFLSTCRLCNAAIVIKIVTMNISARLNMLKSIVLSVEFKKFLQVLKFILGYYQTSKATAH